MGSLNDIVGRLLYLDANTLIYFVEGHSQHAAVLRPLFAKIDRGELTAITSELTIAEVLVHPIRTNSPKIRAEYEAALGPDSTLNTIPVSREILLRAAEIRAVGNIKLPDAIHAATALIYSCSTFLTNDSGFTAIPNLPVALVSNLH